VGNSRTFQIATAGVLVLNLLTVSALGADAAKPGANGGGGGSSGNASCVAVSGGTDINTTTLDVVADGGTAITDSSGGSGNLADPGGNGNNRNNNNNHHNNNNNNHKNNNNNKHHFSAMSLQEFKDRLYQTETASAGNGGVSNASANGGAIQIGDVNSGGNAGNAISVGDTHCAAAPYNAPAGGGGGGGKAAGGGTVRALPNTGAGMSAANPSSSLLLALGSLSMAALALGAELNRLGFRLGSR
jgi:hypothetical protein